MVKLTASQLASIERRRPAWATSVSIDDDGTAWVKLDEALEETERLKGLLQQWWDSSRLSLGRGDYERWLETFTIAVKSELDP